MLAQMVGIEIMIEFAKNFQSARNHADYVLFDTWFLNPAQIVYVHNKKKERLDCVCYEKF